MRVKGIIGDYFVTYPVTKRICRIFGIGQEVMTLVEGDERSLLFDTGMGYGNIRKVVEYMTDKPVTVVLSHGHLDHVGGSYLWDEVFIHENDIPLFETDTREGREKGMNWLMDQRGYDRLTDNTPFVDTRKIRLNTVKEGDVFDLGGITLRVVELAGHTPGSIMLWDEQDGAILVGDAICRHTLMTVPGHEGLAFYRDQLRGFLDKYGDRLNFVLSGHNPSPEQPKIIYDTLESIEGVLSGKYPGYPDEFGKILGTPLMVAKEEVGLEGFCKDGGLGNITWYEK